MVTLRRLVRKHRTTMNGDLQRHCGGPIHAPIQFSRFQVSVWTSGLPAINTEIQYRNKIQILKSDITTTYHACTLSLRTRRKNANRTFPKFVDIGPQYYIHSTVESYGDTTTILVRTLLRVANKQISEPCQCLNLKVLLRLHLLLAIRFNGFWSQRQSF